MRAVVIVCAATLAGCHQLFGLDRVDVANPVLDGGADAPPDQSVLELAVAHVPDPVALGEGELVLDGGTIDTTTNSIGGVQPGVEHAIITMTSGGAAMLVRARDVRLSGTITVRGDKPLIVLAGTITITGVLDASANLAVGGPGASSTGMGAVGGNVNTNNAGSGGGAFGGAGAVGGSAGNLSCPNGMAGSGTSGAPFGDATLDVLEGGGRGGNGGGDAGCTTPGGGGGGAIQLTAVSQITVQGVIDVGGGGGGGGVLCSGRLSHAGAGGGAGGAIYLEAPVIEILGTLAANGGGGGGGGSTLNVGNCTTTNPGMPGADAVPSLLAATGGPRAEMTCSRDGGNGAVGASPATPGGSLNCDGSSGGGGGGVGRIVLRGTVGATNVITPAPTIITP